MSTDIPSLPISLVGRLVVAALLFLVLYPPPLPWGGAAPHVTVLVDDSLSMPRAFTRAAWGKLVAELDGDATISVIRFGASAVAESVSPGEPVSLPRSAALDIGATNIEAALRQALQGLEAGRPNALVLISDLVATRGNTHAGLEAAAELKVPVFLLAPAEAGGSLPFELLDVSVPGRAAVGDRVPVTVSLLGHTRTSAELLLKADDETIARRRLDLAPGTTLSVALDYPARAAGARRLTVLLEGDMPRELPEGPWRRQTHIVEVEGPAPVLYLSQAGMTADVARSLELAGREVSAITPGELRARRGALDRAGVVVLDDVSILDLPDRDWERLLRAVRENGKGLAVLGGGRSFGAGGYRHSRLEAILPVTAEAGRPEEPAAVVFLLDRSGSMAQGSGGLDRFALARSAVLDSIEMLLPGDSAGIIAFADTPEVILPLANPRPGRQASSAALALTPTGGTRLVPALRAALGELNAATESVRLIVLVTDGFAAEDDLDGLAGAIEERGITVIALAVGDDPDTGRLRQLTGFNNGRLLRVNRVATLPRLMPNQIAAQRAPGREGPSATLPALPLPFMPRPVEQWPGVSGYMVSKTKDDAQTFLRSRRGDPLLATGYAGAGRVAVLTAGLGEWAESWWAWPRFGEFLGGLLGWLDPRGGSETLTLKVSERERRLRFELDIGDGADADSPPELLLVLPEGEQHRVRLRPHAPGLYRAEVEATGSGLYRASLRVGDRSIQRAYYRNGDREIADPRARSGLPAALARGGEGNRALAG